MLKLICDVGKNETKYVKIKCEHCEFECKFDKQLRKHTLKYHNIEEENRKYKCDMCDFTTSYVGQLWEHVVAKHPDNNVEFTPRTSKDTILNLLAEQNIDLMEEMINLKRDINVSFEKLAGDLKEMHGDADRKDTSGK